MKPEHLLHWYPRAWRERYGEELLALIQDTLAEGRPTWRLRLSVARGGLRERGHQARHAATAAVKRPTWPDRWGKALVAGLIFAILPGTLTESPPPARGWQAAVALDAVLAAIALTGAVVLAGALAALPALIRFLRAGGWPKIRRRVGWAAGATAVAAGALAGLTLVFGSHPSVQVDGSWTYLAGFFAAGLAVAVAIRRWATAAAAAAGYLTLAPRVRAAQLVLGAVIPAAVTAMVVTLGIWWWAAHSSTTLLVLALVNLALASVVAPKTIGRAIRRSRRLRSAASGR